MTRVVDQDFGKIDGEPIRVIEVRDEGLDRYLAWARRHFYAWGPTPDEAVDKLKARHSGKGHLGDPKGVIAGWRAQGKALRQQGAPI